MTARRSPAGSGRTTAPSVQRVLTDALAAFCGHAVKVAGAGRTDAGVHALGQVAHVDLEKDWRVDKVRDALNAHLRPHPVAVLAAEKVRTVSTRVFRRRSATISIASPIAARSDARPPARMARAAPARCGGDARGRAAPRRQARLHDVPLHRMPGEVAGEDARPARRERARARRSLSGRRRARSCTIRCARWSARSRRSATANGARTISRPRSRRAIARPAAGRAAGRAVPGACRLLRAA